MRRRGAAHQELRPRGSRRVRRIELVHATPQLGQVLVAAGRHGRVEHDHLEQGVACRVVAHQVRAELDEEVDGRPPRSAVNARQITGPSRHFGHQIRLQLGATVDRPHHGALLYAYLFENVGKH